MAITKQQAKKRLIEIINSGRTVCCENCGKVFRSTAGLNSFEYVQTNKERGSRELFYCTKCVRSLRR